MKTRRRAILRISEQFLENFMTNGEIHIKITSGLPKDAKFCGAYFDWRRDNFNLIYESKKFEIVPRGEEMPFPPVPIVTDLRARAKFRRRLYRKLAKIYFFLHGIYSGIGNTLKFFRKKKN